MLEGAVLVSAGAVAVPARVLGLVRRRDHHAARAADGVRRALLRGRAGEPAVDGRRSTSASCSTARSSSSRTPTATWPRSSRRREDVPDVVARAAKEVVRPTLFSMSIIVAAMMPIFTLERVEGRIFRPVALTYAFALGGALLFTLTTRPGAHHGAAQEPQGRGDRAGFLIWLRARYLTALRVALRYPLIAAARRASRARGCAVVADPASSAPSSCPR